MTSCLAWLPAALLLFLPALAGAADGPVTLRHAGIDAAEFADQHNKDKWRAYKQTLEKVFKTRTRDEWCAVMEYTDVCFAPVLSMNEVHEHPHNRERGTFIEVAGIRQPGPAPRFSRTKPEVKRPSPMPGEHNEEALKDYGFSGADIEKLKTAGAI